MCDNPCVSRYNRGCRCDGCRAANRQVKTAARQRRYAEAGAASVCPACDACLPTPAGLARHITKVHGDNLADVADLPQRRMVWPSELDDVSARKIASAAGTSSAVVAQWRITGIPWVMADVVAVKVLGTHPLTVWPEWLGVDEAVAS